MLEEIEQKKLSTGFGGKERERARKRERRKVSELSYLLHNNFTTMCPFDLTDEAGVQIEREKKGGQKREREREVEVDKRKNRERENGGREE